MNTARLTRLGGRPRSAWRHGRHGRQASGGVVGYAGALAALALLVLVRSSWAAQLLLIPLLLIVPGAILLQALRIPGGAIASFPVYVPCASLLVLLGSGLAIDLIGPAAGIARPLRPGPLLVGAVAVCGVLLALAATAPTGSGVPWRSLARPARDLWPLVLPLVAAAGALRLNNGHGSGIAILAVWVCVLAVAGTVLLAPRLEETRLAVVVYAAGLAMMWSFSLRGRLVYGFDIATEYYDAQHTAAVGIWHTAHLHDAYGAMLSLTVLPTELHELSGVPVLLIIKVVYPAVGALLPVMVFGLACRVISRRWAFVAAAFILVQNAFSEELPAITRQEIALLFFLALLAAVLDTQLRRRSQWALAALFSLGMVVSHYSTTYFTIALLTVTIVLQWAVSWLRPMPHVTGAIVIAFVAALAGAALWYGPVTMSTSNLTQFGNELTAEGFNPLPNASPGANAVSSYLNGNTQTAISGARYGQLVHTSYEVGKSFVKPLPSASAPEYALRNSAPPVPPVTAPAVVTGLSLAKLIVSQLANLLAAIGAILLALRRGTPLIARQLALLGVTSVLFLAVIRLSGTVASFYNQDRAFVQAMAVLALTLGWSLEGLARWRGSPRASVVAAVAVALVVLVAEMSGLVGAVLGGGTTANLANGGEDYERFVMTPAELASASWLGQMTRPGQLVYADRYGQLPLTAMTGTHHALLNDITPQTLDQHAWVYASSTNIVDGRARALFNDQLATYVFPRAFLDDNYNTVFTDGASEVFHR